MARGLGCLRPCPGSSSPVCIQAVSVGGMRRGQPSCTPQKLVFCVVGAGLILPQKAACGKHSVGSWFSSSPIKMHVLCLQSLTWCNNVPTIPTFVYTLNSFLSVLALLDLVFQSVAWESRAVIFGFFLGFKCYLCCFVMRSSWSPPVET